MTKEELKYLFTKGFTLSEIMGIEAGETPEPAPEPADPAPAPADPAPEPETPAEPEAAPAADPEEIASLKAQIERLQAQVLAKATTQPDGKKATIEDLVAEF